MYRVASATGLGVPDLGVPEVKKPLSFQSPTARNEFDVPRFVQSKLVPDSERLSIQQVLNQDKEDADLVEASLKDKQSTYPNRLKRIVAQLKEFTGISFDQIYFERNGHGALAQRKNGKTVLAIDLAALNKSEVYLALIVAHEWAHLTKGHLLAESQDETFEKERQADYDAGIFLGSYHYDLDELLRVVLSMPESKDPVHGTSFGRACNIVKGYFHGKELRQAADDDVLASEASKLKI